MNKRKRFHLLLLATAGLLFVQARAYAFYNPTLGRWLNRDPSGEEGSHSLFDFVNSDPIGHIDWLGLYKLPVTVEYNVSPDLFTTEDGHFEAISGGIKPGPVINCKIGSCDGQKLQSLVIDVAGRIQIKRGNTGNERMLTGRTLLAHEQEHAKYYGDYITGQETIYLYLTRACLKPSCFGSWVAYVRHYVEPYESAKLDYRSSVLDCADYKGDCEQRAPLHAVLIQKYAELLRAYQLVQRACK